MSVFSQYTLFWRSSLACTDVFYTECCPVCQHCIPSNAPLLCNKVCPCAIASNIYASIAVGYLDSHAPAFVPCLGTCKVVSLVAVAVERCYSVLGRHLYSR